jgi:hypothetical protein
VLSDLQTIGRTVQPIVLDLYDRSSALALLPQIASVVPNPTKVKTLTMEWVTLFPNLRKWVGDRVVQKSFQKNLSITGEPFEITDSFDRYEIERGTALATVQQKSAAIAEGFAVGKLMLAFRVLRYNLLTYDGQDFFDTDHEKEDGATYSNVVAVDRADATAPSIVEAREELSEALFRLMQIRLWGDVLASAEDVQKNLIVVVRSNSVFKTFNKLRTEDSFGADRNTWKGAFSLWMDYNPLAGTENKVDAILSIPNGPRPVLFMPTREPSGIEFDLSDAFKTRQVSFGLDGEYGVAPGFPQTAVRIDPD